MATKKPPAYKAIKKFAVQEPPTGNLVWYDVGKSVPPEVISRLSAHSLPYLVEDTTAKPKRKTNAKSKKPTQRKSRKQSPKK